MQDCTGFHRLAISETDADRLQAHWDGFRDNDPTHEEHAADLRDLSKAWRAELSDNIADGNAEAAAKSAAILREIHAELTGPRLTAYTPTGDGSDQFVYERIMQHLEIADALLIAGSPDADAVFTVLRYYREACPAMSHAALSDYYARHAGI